MDNEEFNYLEQELNRLSKAAKRNLDLYSSELFIRHVRSIREKAEQGDSNAQCLLGKCYYWSEGISTNTLEYFKPTGLPTDHVEATEWFRKAAEQGHAEAQRCLNAGIVTSCA